MKHRKRTGNSGDAAEKQAHPIKEEVREKTAKEKRDSAADGENRRMTSIVRRLHWYGLRKTVGMYFGMDVFLFLSLLTGWILDREYILLGSVFSVGKRSLEASGGVWRQLSYVVRGEEGEILLSTPLFPMIEYLGWFLLVIICIQLAKILLRYGSEDRKIRRILGPINEIALKAEELNRMAFSEDKYQMIEEAISELEPEASEELISFGDSELQGVEVAMNNLLIHMRNAYRQQARFVNDASHELRTPIAVIQGYVNMLSRWGREDKKVLDESITAITHETEHMRRLVEQLLFLARGDSGKHRLSLEPVQLKDLMQEIYEESLLIDENHLYHFSAPDDIIQINADATMFKQAVRILIDNAAKYTPAGGEIRLSCGFLADKMAWVQIQDCGIGMTPENVSHMFERFYRADDARAYQGTGLGLSIAKWIVDKHGGHFEILSRTELGTRIRIVVPA